MKTFLVIDKATGQEVYRYTIDAAGPIVFAETDVFPPSGFRQEEVLPEVPPKQPVYGGQRVLPRTDFLRLFTQAERMAIRTEAKQNAVLEDFMALMDSNPTTNLDDPDTVAGVTLLEQAGLIGAGRAVEILNG